MAARTILSMLSFQILYLIFVITIPLCVASPASYDRLDSPHDINSSASIHDFLLTREEPELLRSRTDGTVRGSIILYNGKIHTMDESNRIVSVVAIKDGTIVYVGNSRDEAVRKGSVDFTPRLVNLRGRFTIPGLIDSHNHIVLLGNRPGYHTPLEFALNISQVLSTYRVRASSVPKGAFITTIGGFHTNQFAELRLPTLSELDAVAPDHPVFISIGFSGPATTNTLGKTDFETQVAPELRVTIAANGSIASGLENGKALLALRRQLTLDDRKRSVRDAMVHAALVGVTTHIDQGAFNATDTPTDWSSSEDLYRFHNPWLSIYNDFATGVSDYVPKIRIRLNFLHQDTVPSVPTLTQRLLNTFPFFGNDMVRTGGIGEFATDLPNYSSGPVFEAAMEKLAQSGWRYETHALGGGDDAMIIRAWETLNTKYDITKLRWVLAHVPLITTEFILRLKALGAGINLSSYLYFIGTGNFTNPAGPPFRRILETGIPVGFGGDGANIAPLSPWPQIYYAVTGKNAKGELINPGETIERLDALRMYTRGNNWFLGGPDEGRFGSLEVGRVGDVVVLNDDFFKVEDEKLKQLRSVLTVLGGVVVHDEMK